MLIAISIILVTQIVFLALHATLTFRQFDYYSTVPSDVNQAAQLLVLPNLLLANLFLPVPADLLKNARTIVDNVMVHPL